MQNKFKVGDVVEIVGSPDGDNTKWNFTDGFGNNWVDCMDEALGKTGVIVEVEGTGVTLDNIAYRYPHQALKLKTETKEPEMKITKDKEYRVVGTHEPVRIICTDRIDNKASKLQCVALYTDHRGDEGLLLVSDSGLNCWGKKIIEEVPEVDWSKVKVDTPIWICNQTEEYEPRHFAEYKNDSVYFYGNGRSSHTSKGVTAVFKEHASLTNPNEKA